MWHQEHMFVLGHLGIGKKIANPFLRDLPLAPFFLGAVLPDLIDKPLYYGLVFATGKRASELEFITGTRTLGHTAIFFLLLAVAARLRHSLALRALSIGIFTHFVLDAVSGLATGLENISAIVAFLWPLMGPFPVYPFQSGEEHLRTIGRMELLLGEILGAVLLAQDYISRRNTR